MSYGEPEISEDDALDIWRGEHPKCEHCQERCCIRPESCYSCGGKDIGVAVGPDRNHVHVGCKDAYANAVAVSDVADAVKVLRTRDGVAVTDEQVTERGRNIVQRLIALGWGPL